MPQTQEHEPSETHEAGRLGKITNSRAGLLLLLFCVTGFLGLPLLWISKRFSTTEKIVWSVVNCIYTTVLISITVAVCWWSYNRIAESLGW